MSFSIPPKSWGGLLRTQVKRSGYSVEYSKPQLVNGSLSPPPSRCYPGTVCYMVIVTVNNLDFFGFGPSPSLARRFAEFEAYNSLHPLPVKVVEEVRSSVAVKGTDVESDSDDMERLSRCSSECEFDEGILKTDRLHVYNGVNEHHSNVDEPEQTSDTYTGSRLNTDLEMSNVDQSLKQSHAPVQLTKQEPQDVSPMSSAQIATGETDDDNFCAIPYSSNSEINETTQVNVPSSFEEYHAVLEKPPPIPPLVGPNVWDHGMVPRNSRDVVTALYEVAKQKRVRVRFDCKVIGSKNAKIAVVLAEAAGFSFEGRSARTYFAKTEAASKLLNVLQQLPVPVVNSNFPPSLPPTHHTYDPKPNHNVPYLQCRSLANTQDPGCMDGACATKQSVSVTQSPTGSKSSSSDEQSSTQSSSFISYNPVGQLNELLAKEHLDATVYARSVTSVGMFLEFTCTASAKGLSAKGVGSSKRLAKRHAAENLLATMKAQGMNIEATVTQPKAKAKTRATPSSQHSMANYHARSHSTPPTPGTVFHRAPPNQQFRPTSRQIQMPDIRPTHFAPPTAPPPCFRPSYPFGPPPSSPGTPVSPRHPPPVWYPPQQLRPPSLPVSHSKRPNVLSTESESDSESEVVSSGLREVIPMCHSDQKPPAQRQKPPVQLNKQQHNVNRRKVLLPYPPDLHERMDASYLAGNQSKNPELKKGVIPFIHRHIPMPGVRVSSLSEPGTQLCHMSGARPSHTRTRTASQARVYPYQPPPPLNPPCVSKHFPQNPKVTPSMLESRYVVRSDPLHFVTRLPQKRSTPWSSPSGDSPESSGKPPWRKIFQDNVRSGKMGIPLRSKTSPNFPVDFQFHSKLTAVKPWLRPVCEVWSTDDEEDRRAATNPSSIPLPDSETDETSDNAAHTASPSYSPSLASKEGKDPVPSPQDVLVDVKWSEKVTSELEETSDVFGSTESECGRTPNVAHLCTRGLVDGAPPVTEVWVSDSEDDFHHTDIIDKDIYSDESIQLSNLSQPNGKSCMMMSDSDSDKSNNEECTLQHAVESSNRKSISSTFNSLTSNQAGNGIAEVFPPVTEVWNLWSEEERDKTVSQELNKSNTTDSDAPICEPWSTHSDEDGVMNPGSGSSGKRQRTTDTKFTSDSEGAVYPSFQLWSSDSDNNKGVENVAAPIDRLPLHPLLASAACKISTVRNNGGKRHRNGKMSSIKVKHIVKTASSNSSVSSEHSDTQVSTSLLQRDAVSPSDGVHDSHDGGDLRMATDKFSLDKVYKISGSVECSLLEDCSVCLPSEGSLQAVAAVLD